MSCYCYSDFCFVFVFWFLDSCHLKSCNALLLLALHPQQAIVMRKGFNGLQFLSSDCLARIIVLKMDILNIFLNNSNFSHSFYLLRSGLISPSLPPARKEAYLSFKQSPGNPKLPLRPPTKSTLFLYLFEYGEAKYA